MRSGHVQRVDVCAFTDLAEAGRIVVEIEGCSVLVLLVGNTVYAVRNECTHLAFPLSNGRVVDGALMCVRHGARFCLADGRPVSGPAVRPVQVYPVHVHAGRVEVDFVSCQPSPFEMIRKEQE